MKRFAYIAIAAAAFAFGTTACKKAHDAGNDSMSAGSSHITASNGQSGTVTDTSMASAPAAAAKDGASPGSSQ
ncbi:hypothetical protein [Paraburkholderia solisilvae]|uniref:Lipoprotein n=1 Tax=Paraburkholderia solisilvae TaxID=624376 RepID=A0A6J5CYA4_9BURK|nr:hypothetical protein [Paraburkholderia solisilvae]CAB3745954.1 hypothetical protein LMG29739_00065 [Paraburkholderia solisilvae]